MKDTLRQSMGWLHTWCGLLFGWVLFGVLLTGSLAVFYTEINLWTTPELGSPVAIDRDIAVRMGRDYLTRVAPDARQWRIVIPTPREPVLRLVWTDRAGKATTHRLNPQTGARIPRDMDAGFFFMRYHYTLGIDRKSSQLGFLIVGAAGLAMLVASISGVIIHKRIFRDFFTFRPRASRQRAWMDAHNVLSVLPLPFHVMMAYTGLVLIYYAYIPAGIAMLNGGDVKAYQSAAAQSLYVDLDTPPGQPQPTVDLMPLVTRAEQAWGGGPAVNVYVSNPDRANAAVEVWRQRDDRIGNFPDRVDFAGSDGTLLRVLVKRSPARQTQSFLTGLHFIEWGGTTARWLYFLTGLASAAMVAAGLVLFTEKRARRGSSSFHGFASRITVAAVAGNMVASAAYLLGEQLLPAGMEDRRGVAACIFFTAWLACLIHAGIRRWAQAWREQLHAAALLCLLLPVASAVAGLPLWHKIAQGDWIRAGADLTAIAIGICLWIAARKVSSRTREPS
ncbi:PepSY-associated TM helix domain-containing protein [Novosphingobium sp. BL-8H]|uniref:PepSY-associated TM helix domain-containing protein n=1 Tax=Novosphingobium sp. BL-8H TaxID=3127640 RepID=UPI003757D42C